MCAAIPRRAAAKSSSSKQGQRSTSRCSANWATPSASIRRAVSTWSACNIKRNKEKAPQSGAFSYASNLFLNERKEPHEAGTLDGLLDGALLLGGEARALAAHHFAVRVDELLQKVDVFVVDVTDIVLREN